MFRIARLPSRTRTANAWVTELRYADDNYTMAHEFEDIQSVYAIRTHHQYDKRTRSVSKHDRDINHNLEPKSKSRSTNWTRRILNNFYTLAAWKDIKGIRWKKDVDNWINSSLGAEEVKSYIQKSLRQSWRNANTKLSCCNFDSPVRLSDLGTEKRSESLKDSIKWNFIKPCGTCGRTRSRTMFSTPRWRAYKTSRLTTDFAWADI